MKSVLIAIRPKWVEKITSGGKDNRSAKDRTERSAT